MRLITLTSIVILLSITPLATAQESKPVPADAVFTPAAGVKEVPFKLSREKGAYLGVSSAPVPEVLRSQLKMRRGVGLVIERVEKGSPAEQEGLKQHDIIEKLDDQLLINSQQFAALVRIYNPGDQVKLTGLRQGQPLTVTIRLTEREMPVLGEGVLKLDWNGDGVNWIGNVGDGAGFLSVRRRIADTGKLQTMVKELNLGNDGKWMAMFGDEEHKLIFQGDGQKIELDINDADRKSIWKGPVDTEEQKAGIPKSVRASVDRALEQIKSQRPVVEKPAP